jgi:hypothetical protein
MLLFRSAEHVGEWCRQRGRGIGATITVGNLWDLARRWYGDRLDPAWRRRPTEEAEQVFAGVGLTGDFWRLHPA